MGTDERRLILHVGMHKTGSTSIQHWLRHTAFDDAHYFDWEQPNQSNLFMILFEDDAQDYFAFKKKGLTKSDIDALRVQQRKLLIRQIKTSKKGTFVFSAERISSAPEPAVRRMHKLFYRHFSKIDVYGYVRCPASFMTSMFQQHLKTGTVRTKMQHLWPHYKKRFARLDEIFGADNVHLRLYESLRARNTDAVTDFANWVGLPANEEAERHRNPSMQSSAAALLYLYRTDAQNALPEDVRRKRDQFVINNLWKVEGAPFSMNLQPDTPEQQIKMSDDMEWMSKRLGVEINDLGQKKEGSVVFSDETDLVRLAIMSSHLLFPEEALDKLDGDAPGARDAAVRRLVRFSQRA